VTLFGAGSVVPFLVLWMFGTSVCQHFRLFSQALNQVLLNRLIYQRANFQQHKSVIIFQLLGALPLESVGRLVRQIPIEYLNHTKPFYAILF